MGSPAAVGAGRRAYDERMFLVVIGILSIILAFPRPPYLLLRDPGAILALTALATLLPPLAAWLASRRCLRALERHIEDPEIGQRLLSSGLGWTQGLLGVGHAAILLTTDLLRMCDRAPWLGKLLVAPGLLAVTPFLLSLTLVWIASYPADRAIRQIALEASLLRGAPTRPVWSLSDYLVYNLRSQVLFIFAPMFLILAARDLIEMYEKPLARFSRSVLMPPTPAGANPALAYDFLPDLLLGASAGVIALLAPLFLRYVWVTRPLPQGPLRDRLLHLCLQLRMRCREILVWQSGGMIVNAAVMGVFSPLRFVLITDAMLEQMDDTRIEAVFGHEAGHVKRKHLWYFLLFAFISGCAVMVLSALRPMFSASEYQLVTGIFATGLILKWTLLFGWISRRFERQADLYGVRTLALANLPCHLPCKLHRQGGGPAPAGDPLCQSAAHIFAATLHDVAHLNGIPPEARSWRHGSIAKRSRTVVQMAQDPLATARFERMVGVIQGLILLGALAAAAVTVWQVELWRPLLRLIELLK